MTTEGMTIKVDSEAARVFNSAPAEEQRKMEALLGSLVERDRRGGCSSSERSDGRNRSGGPTKRNDLRDIGVHA